MQAAARALVALVVTLVGLAAVCQVATATPRVTAEGRAYFPSRYYYTTIVGEFAITFADDLPDGSKVRAHYGFGGVNVIYDASGPRTVELLWEGINDVDMRWVAPHEWRAQFDQTLSERGSARKLDALQFVFAVTLPSGAVYYVKGSESRLGYFEAPLPNASDGGDTSVMQVLPLSQVRRER